MSMKTMGDNMDESRRSQAGLAESACNLGHGEDRRSRGWVIVGSCHGVCIIPADELHDYSCGHAWTLLLCAAALACLVFI
jgi:hypothetical protein